MKSAGFVSLCRRTFAVGLLGLLSASHLWAQQTACPFVSAPGTSTMKAVVFLTNEDIAAANDSVSLKSPFLGFVLSTLMTGIPVGAALAMDDNHNSAAPPVLFAAGLVFGPATGYFYGGEWGRGFLGAGIRLGIGGISILLMGAQFGTASANSFYGAIVIGAIGFAFVAVDALVDIFSVASHIREQNEVQKVFGVNVHPTWSLATHSAGIQITFGL